MTLFARALAERAEAYGPLILTGSEADRRLAECDHAHAYTLLAWPADVAYQAGEEIEQQVPRFWRFFRAYGLGFSRAEARELSKDNPLCGLPMPPETYTGFLADWPLVAGRRGPS